MTSKAKHMARSHRSYDSAMHTARTAGSKNHFTASRKKDPLKGNILKRMLARMFGGRLPDAL